MRRRLYLLYAAALLGMADAAYLTFVHYMPAALLCPNSGPISCEAVLTSGYSVVLGVPIALAGFAWFAAELLVSTRTKNKHFRYLLGLAGLAAIAYSLISMSIIGKVCVYCSALDALIAAMIALSIW